MIPPVKRANIPTAGASELRRGEYELFRDLIYRRSGINLGGQKMQLLRARLGKRMRAGGFESYRAYYVFIKNDPSGLELTHLIDAVSTNTTQLFREHQHFEFLSEAVKRWTSERRRRRMPIRIWSAGCSSGEEPYSIAMTMDDLQCHRTALRFKILATDISTRMLARAQRGEFTLDRLAGVPAEFKQRYFVRVDQGDAIRMRVHPRLRDMVWFVRFNLMRKRFPFRNGLDVIFCRNVMIYFDRPTQERLVAEFARVLNPGGFLLIGRSESLSNVRNSLVYVRPTVYRKP